MISPVPACYAVEEFVLKRALKAMIEAADDLEAEINERFSEEKLKHPAEVRRRARDMESVIKLRKSVQELNETSGFYWEGADTCPASSRP